MSEERKIRNLVESDGEDVCLNDIFNTLVEASHKARELEYGSKRVDLKDFKRLLREARSNLDVLYERVRGEVTTSVNDIAAVKNKNYKGRSAEEMQKARDAKKVN